MTESQKRNARRRLAKQRAMSASQLTLSFTCHYWDAPSLDLHHTHVMEGSVDRRRYVSWRGKFPTLGGPISMSTLDIPDFTCIYRLDAEDPMDYLGGLKGVLNGIIKTIHTGHYRGLLFTRNGELRDTRYYRLECRGQYGARAPWRLKWRGVDVETVVADVIAACSR